VRKERVRGFSLIDVEKTNSMLKEEKTVIWDVIFGIRTNVSQYLLPVSSGWKTALSYIAEDSILNIHLHDNLKCRKLMYKLVYYVYPQQH
jgi:hypothetical protein